MKVNLSANTFLVFCGFSTVMAFANERILSREVLLSQGYKVQQRHSFIDSSEVLQKHSLIWPVQFEGASHNMGNVMMQFQQYNGGSAYFHGGCDLRTVAGENLVAPVSGRVEAGHYSYAVDENGSLEKYMLPWPQYGEALYFEVAIVTELGHRFEFHHVDRTSLGPELKAALNAGNAYLNHGDFLGKVIRWPVSGVDGVAYHHTHYNILNSSGVNLNPEYYSELIADERPPTIHNVFIVGHNGVVEELKEGFELGFTPREFVVAVSDFKNENVYTHTVSYLKLSFENGIGVLSDFRERLITEEGAFPNIWQVFSRRLTLSDGRVFSTRGDYRNNFFLMRLKVPEGADGAFKIEALDVNGNAANFNGRISAGSI